MAQNLSFAKASQLLFISQPSVTNQIKTLEKEYGIELFRRKNNGKIELTLDELVLIYSTKNIIIKKFTFQASSAELGKYVLILKEKSPK